MEAVGQWLGMGEKEEPPPKVSSFEQRTVEFTRAAYAPFRKLRTSLSSTSSTTRKLFNTPSEGAGSPERGSPDRVQRNSDLMGGVYARYRKSKDNAEVVTQAKHEKLARDHRRREIAAVQHVETLEKRARVLGRDMEPKEHHEQVVNASADQVRAHRVLIKEAIEENRQIMIEELRQRVDSQREGFANWDGRMDELEEAEAEAKRLEHAIDKQGRRRAKERSKIQMAKKNREMVLAVQEDDRMHEAMSMSYRTNAMRAEGRRIKALYNKEEKKINEAEHLRMAADAKASVLATKENAQRVKQENVNSAFQRVAHHREDHAEKLSKTKTRTYKKNRDKRNAVYANRYVKSDEKAEFDGTTFQKLYNTGDDDVRSELDEVNVDMYHRILTVQGREAGDIDEHAREVEEERNRLLAEGRLRRQAEHARIAAQNAANKQRISSVTKSIDQDSLVDVSAWRREEMQIAATERREAEKAAIERENAKIKRRIESARSVTDCGIGAEVDELRVRFAERSKVQKEIAKRNLEEQNTKLRRIGALGDAASEAPLGGRPKKNVEQQREEEMARLREQNEVMRLRISEYKGFIDRSDRKEETWLAWLFPCAPAPVEKVEWGMDGRRVVHHHGL